jgi:hypothetical protein
MHYLRKYEILRQNDPVIFGVLAALNVKMSAYPYACVVLEDVE